MAGKEPERMSDGEVIWSAREAELWEAVKPVKDPEIGIGIVDLGLIYGIREEGGGKVIVRLTMTSPYCPYAPALMAEVQSALAAVPGVTDVTLDLVWDPPWDPRTMANEEVRMSLGIFD